MSTPATAAPTDDRDERLARLLDELASEQRAGRTPDVRAVACQHPDLADELFQLWGTIQLAKELAPPSSSGNVHSRPTLPPNVDQGPVGPRKHAGIIGDYELLEELGRGAMGVVYRARQISLDRTVALKMVLRGDLASASDLARFRAEAESAAKLQHPNIVTVHEVGEVDGQAYFSMRHVEGQTLSARLAGGPLPPREAARLLAPLARAIHYAHQQGILHRDLKPSNVLLDHDGQPHVSDFGLAKRVESGARLTQTGAIVGTPSYMPPEQAAGSRGALGPASDVYSLGAILYEMLTGRPPFQAATPFDTLLLVLEQDLVPPRLLNPIVDRELEMICLKCLQKPTDLRYASAAALADDVEAFLRGEPTSARPISFVYFIDQLFRETHHASVLENWGLLWMAHSFKAFAMCAVTSLMYWLGVHEHWPYLLLWGVGLVAWGVFFWQWRRRGGPVTFIERQLAHLYGGAVCGCIGTFVVEVLLGRPVLSLSPVLAVVGGMLFVSKAGMLSGWFYVAAAAMFLLAIPMALFDPGTGLLLLGALTFPCFFIPGLKYYRQRRKTSRAA